MIYVVCLMNFNPNDENYTSLTCFNKKKMLKTYEESVYLIRIGLVNVSI